MLAAGGIILLLLAFTAARFYRCSPIKNEPRNIRGVISYRRSFNDLNPVQLASARRHGISPLKDRGDVGKMADNLERIEDCELYVVDRLTHSVPYLVPRAELLLRDIGQAFADSLESKGLNPNRLIVTSLLRTVEDQKKLSRGNSNAAKKSCHSYATTFDITYKRFRKKKFKLWHPYESVSAETLKMVLSEVLRDKKKEKRCHVKHEVRQGCFHITTR